MKLGKFVILSLAIVSTSIADPVVSVTSSCSNSTCTGGVQPGTVFESGVQSLDVYTSATTAATLVPPLTMGEVWDPFYVAIEVTLQTYGSGPGALIVDPLYTFSSSQDYPEEFDALITGDVNNDADPQIICGGLPGGASSGNSPICSGEAAIPIALGSQVQLVLRESNDSGLAIPATSTLSTELNLWTEDAAGDTSPVSLVASTPEPASLFIVGFGLAVGILRSIRRQLARMRPSQAEACK